MVKVIMVAMGKDPITLEFKDIYKACRTMQVLSDSVVGGCAFTVSFQKEEPVRSRFEMPKFTEIPPEELEDVRELFKSGIILEVQKNE